MNDPVQAMSLGAMFVIGLFGSGHCVGMCGGIATGLGFATQGQRRTALVVGYNLGRIFSYAIAGGLVAALGYWGSSYLAIGPWLRIVAGVILIMMGCYLAGWWQLLSYLEKAGSRLWRHIQPLGKRLMPVTSFPQALALGAVWGWLPCGLVYTALAYSATSVHPVSGALMMLAFGLGTMPAMIVGGLFAGTLRQWVQRKIVRTALALLMIIFGVWTLVSSATHIQQMQATDGEMQHHHHHH